MLRLDPERLEERRVGVYIQVARPQPPEDVGKQVRVAVDEDAVLVVAELRQGLAGQPQQASFGSEGTRPV